jgi:cysteine synthase A
MLTLAQEMREAGEQGSILSLLCDAGERYLGNYHCATWVSENFGDCKQSEHWVQHAMTAGQTC